jgi:mono/diheme cytochrome c family protein
MKSRSLPLLALLALLALTGCTFSLSEDITPPPGYRTPTPVPTVGLLFPSEPPSPARGAPLYAENCLPCHGENGLGNGPQAPQLPAAVPAIGLAEIARQSTPAEWYEAVTLGRPERGMPAFQNLSEQERWDVLAYIYTLSLPAEELTQAQSLYAENCAECHGLQGGRLPAADFSNPASLAETSGVAAGRIIANGIAGSMPAFGEQLSEAEIRLLTAYLRVLAFDLAPLAATEAAPAAATVEAAPAISSEPPLETPVEASLTSTPETITVSGRIVHAAGLSLPPALPVILHIYDATQQVEQRTALAGPDGAFLFSDLPPMPGGGYLVTVEYAGVSYASAPGFYDEASIQFDLPVTIYESTTDFSLLRLRQVHTIMDFSTRGLVQISEIYIFTNPGPTTVIVETDGSSIPFIQVPAEAGTAVTFQLSEGSAPLYPATNGFAILPGEGLQYGIVAIFSLPYERRLEWDHAFLLPVDSLDILVPAGVRVRNDRLIDRGLNRIQGAEYHIYEAASLAAGEPLVLTITGLPGESGALNLGEQSSLILGMGALGIIFIAIGIYLFLRDRARSEDEDETAEDALGDDPQAIMDAILALDDQRQAGGLSEKAYQERRRALKARLRELL